MSVLFSINPSNDTINPLIQLIQDTASKSETMLLERGNSVCGQLDGLQKPSASILIQIITGLVAVLAVAVNYWYSNKSLKIADTSYDQLVKESKNNYEKHQQTLNTIKEQTDKLYSQSFQTEYRNHLSDCKATIELVINYLQRNFSNIVWNVQTNDYVFQLLQPTKKSATALYSMVVLDNNCTTELKNAIIICSQLGDKELNSRDDVEGLIKQLKACKSIFENQLNIVSDK